MGDPLEHGLLREQVGDDPESLGFGLRLAGRTGRQVGRVLPGNATAGVQVLDDGSALRNRLAAARNASSADAYFNGAGARGTDAQYSDYSGPSRTSD
jgi:hypothetical protein